MNSSFNTRRHEAPSTSSHRLESKDQCRQADLQVATVGAFVETTSPSEAHPRPFLCDSGDEGHDIPGEIAGFFGPDPLTEKLNEEFVETAMAWFEHSAATGPEVSDYQFFELQMPGPPIDASRVDERKRRFDSGRSENVKRPRVEVVEGDSSTTRRASDPFAHVDLPAPVVEKSKTGGDSYTGSHLHRRLRNCGLENDLVRGLRSARSYEDASCCMKGSAMAEVGSLVKHCPGVRSLLICLRF